MGIPKANEETKIIKKNMEAKNCWENKIYQTNIRKFGT